MVYSRMARSIFVKSTEGPVRGKKRLTRLGVELPVSTKNLQEPILCTTIAAQHIASATCTGLGSSDFDQSCEATHSCAAKTRTAASS